MESDPIVGLTQGEGGSGAGAPPQRDSNCPATVEAGTRPLRHVAIDLAESIAECVGRADDAFTGIPEHDECVFIKNRSGVMVYANASHRQFFSPEQSPIGRTAHAFLHPSIVSAAEKLDELILAGCPYVECEHDGVGPDGATYRMRTHKRSLRSLGHPGLALVGVTRLVARDEEPAATPGRVDLAEAADGFRSLSERDRDICRQTALGVSSRELATELAMTPRGVELRKQKAFARLGVSKAVDLARLLVRLQDRGYFDLGL